MKEKNVLLKDQIKFDKIRVELRDWLYNAGILGFIRVMSYGLDNISEEINIQDTYIEFNRKSLNGFTEKFFELAFKMHGKYDSIKTWLYEIKDDLVNSENVNVLERKFRLKNHTEEELIRIILEEIKKRWNGVNYEKLKKINKKDYNTINDLKSLVNELIEILEKQRSFFVEREVQTFLKGIVGEGSFLNSSINKDQKKIFQKDFENPIKENKNKEDKKFNCIFCNSRRAKVNTIFSTGLVFYQGLNRDSFNFTWGFNPNLPICEICELIYFCHWAGYTKSTRNKTYLFVNDDSSIKNLWDKNQLLTKILQRDKKENILINYFYELLLLEEKEISTYTLQNIAIIETDLENKVMPKVLSLHVTRSQAKFIKDNHKKLKWLATLYYKIKDEYKNILQEFLNLVLQRKLNFGWVNRLIKFYLQSQSDKKTFIQVNYNPSYLQNIIILTANYLKTINQKSLDMEQNYIWHIYHLGNDMQKTLRASQAENKINSIAYRLLNAVRTNDISTFLNVLLRLYMGYGMEVPKSFINTLGSDEKFEIIGLSYINGLLGESLTDKSEYNQTE